MEQLKIYDLMDISEEITKEYNCNNNFAIIFNQFMKFWVNDRLVEKYKNYKNIDLLKRYEIILRKKKIQNFFNNEIYNYHCTKVDVKHINLMINLMILDEIEKQNFKKETTSIILLFKELCKYNKTKKETLNINRMFKKLRIRMSNSNSNNSLIFDWVSQKTYTRYLGRNSNPIIFNMKGQTASNLIHLFDSVNPLLGGLIALYLFERGGINIFDYDYIYNESGLINPLVRQKSLF